MEAAVKASSSSPASPTANAEEAAGICGRTTKTRANIGPMHVHVFTAKVRAVRVVVFFLHC